MVGGVNGLLSVGMRHSFLITGHQVKGVPAHALDPEVVATPQQLTLRQAQAMSTSNGADSL